MKLVAALALVTAPLLAPIAQAAPADLYVAVPVSPSAKPSVITRSTVWHLRDQAYVAGAAPERPAVLCELIVRQVGALASFAVAGKAYDADQLARCNAKAKQG